MPTAAASRCRSLLVPTKHDTSVSPGIGNSHNERRPVAQGHERRFATAASTLERPRIADNLRTPRERRRDALRSGSRVASQRNVGQGQELPETDVASTTSAPLRNGHRKQSLLVLAEESGERIAASDAGKSVEQPLLRPDDKSHPRCGQDNEKPGHHAQGKGRAAAGDCKNNLGNGIGREPDQYWKAGIDRKRLPRSAAS